MLCSSRRMGSSGRTVLWALCLLQLLAAGSAKIIWKRALRERLPERSHVEEVSAPSHRQPRADHCPPPPRTLPPGACQAVRCQADSKCLQHQRCCYNGCAYACLEAVPPPPVLDWLVQPKPRWLGGNGWLLDGPEEVLQAEACSTTEDGAEPLLCPSGYECHILIPGDMAEGIPNRGQCVRQRRQADGRFLRRKFYKEYPDGDSKYVAEPGRNNTGPSNKAPGRSWSDGLTGVVEQVTGMRNRTPRGQRRSQEEVTWSLRTGHQKEPPAQGHEVAAPRSPPITGTEKPANTRGPWSWEGKQHLSGSRVQAHEHEHSSTS
ncbi:WAP four-disulfide core domain protein 1 isoform X3 [Fukomys damarensis]|uniref:WAP four-disulfide core domain protein 1 isoform X3 n=1 Tax=Fukomys damarensis TaxID=885580 RepID=UPI00053F5CE6|nr:WAP four-disulfide core domain protein 1 isoform X3 [Fukomys damarensis]